MDNNKIEVILDKLIDASKNKKIDWVPTPKASGLYQAVLGNSLVFINLTGGEYAFSIYNEKGSVIAKVSEATYYFKLKELYELARIKALKIDEGLKSIDDFLSNL
jgi:hypothetical protein